MDRHSVEIVAAALLTLAFLAIAGCQSNAQTASVIGGLVGAGIGQIAGGDTEGTLIGAAVGAGAGYIIGNESDKNEARNERRYVREEMRYVTVNMTNSNGSVSRVRLQKHGIGYLGTRGEFYDHLPTEGELRPVYGF